MVLHSDEHMEVEHDPFSRVVSFTKQELLSTSFCRIRPKRPGMCRNMVCSLIGAKHVCKPQYF